MLLPSLSQASVLVILVSLLSSTHAHTWVEELRIIAANGSYVGAPGYIRGQVDRSAPGGPDKAMTYLETSDPTGFMCKDTQRSQTQPPNFPNLQASPGDMIALQYQENGHVTLPATQAGKPANRGTVYIYGTTQPKADEKFADIFKVWNAEGTGGDKRGVLLSTQNFDDGQCYQLNSGTIATARKSQFAHEAIQPQGESLWCQNNIKLPQNLPVGKLYTIYWVWDWPTLPNVDPGLPKGKNETYTTCVDVSTVGAKGVGSNKDVAGVSFVKGQNLANAGISSYMPSLGAGKNVFVTDAPQGNAGSAAPPTPPAPVVTLQPALSQPESPATTPVPPPASTPVPPPASTPVPPLVTVKPLTTLMTTMTMSPPEVTPTPVTIPGVALTTSTSTVIVTPQASFTSPSVSGIPETGNSNCTSSMGKRSRIFDNVPPAKRASRARRGSAKFRLL